MQVLIPDFQEYSIALNPDNPMDGTRRLRVVCRETSQVSDGYHTFDELYKHRHLLFFALLIQHSSNAYKSRLHYDGSSYEGWFIAGCDLFTEPIAYHLPNSIWDLCPVRTVERAPEWDGHTSNDLVDHVETWLSRFTASTRQ